MPVFVIPSCFVIAMDLPVEIPPVIPTTDICKNIDILVCGAEQAFLPVSRQQAKSPLGAQATSLCSAYAAERKARFLPGSGLAFCSIRRRISAHLFSSSAIWKASSATPIPEIGVV